jgi:hypothetical protein
LEKKDKNKNKGIRFSDNIVEVEEPTEQKPKRVRFNDKDIPNLESVQVTHENENIMSDESSDSNLDVSQIEIDEDVSNIMLNF